MGIFSFLKKTKYADGAVLLTVEGMHCGHCSARVESALSAVPGVKKVTVHLEEKIAEVIETSKGAADREAMKAAVNALGFTVVDVK